MKNIAVTRYYGTGSSAIIDVLSEFKGVKFALGRSTNIPICSAVMAYLICIHYFSAIIQITILGIWRLIVLRTKCTSNILMILDGMGLIEKSLDRNI